MRKLFAMIWMVGSIMLAGQAQAQQVEVFVDPAFQPALLEILPEFTERTGFEVNLSIAPSGILVERIRSGAEADLFLPAGEEYMRRVMEVGLVDVSLKRNILSLPPLETEEPGEFAEPRYTSAAVLVHSPHRLQAMALLEFLCSDTARAAFDRQGFGLP